MAAGELHRGVVTRTSPNGVWVKMQSRWPNVEFGPLPILANAVRVGPITSANTDDGDGPHQHTVAKTTWLADLVAKGDNVLVAETSTDDFVILGVLRRGVSTTGGL